MSGGPWLGRHVQEDEAGQSEVWVISYVRASAQALIALASVDDFPEGARQIRALVDAVEMVVRRVTKNGVPVDLDTIPFDLLVEVAEGHPSFRDAAESGRPAEDRAGARGGADGTSVGDP